MLTFYPLKNTRRKLFKAILVAALISVMSLGIIPIRSKAGSKTSQLVFSQLNNNTINTDVIKINIHIFHKENMAKLDHLWTSINAANPIDSPVTFKFHAKSIKNHEKLKSFLKNLRSHHGDVSLIEMLDRKQSIKSAMINAWYPKSKHEFAIFLDSNIIVSPHFLEYTEQTIFEYFVKPNNESKHCVGISLYNLRYDHVHERKWDAPVEVFTPYALQLPQVHSAIFAPLPWIQFRKWQQNLPSNYNALIPNSMTNRWNSQNSCWKELSRFMFLNGLVMLYPNFPNGLSLASRQGQELGRLASVKDSGGPILKLSSPQSSLNDTRFVLLEGKRLVLRMASSSLKPIHQVKLFNTYFEPKVTLRESKDDILLDSSFEKCTLIMNVYDRINTLLERIRHYESFSKLDRIIIVWNHQELKPHFNVSATLRNQPLPLKLLNTEQPTYEFLIPVHILQQVNSSLNNRYLPFPEIRTDCILSMDDDFDYPHHQLSYSISLFQGHFFNHAIGFKHMGRSHKRLEDGTYEYATEIDKGASMVLPTGMVFHRKYLRMYSFELPSLAREIVDSKTNGEDILFNLMVANHTQSCPVVVNMFARGVAMDNGLWMKTDHFEDRSLCLTRLVNEVYGGKIPLKFSTKFFKGIGRDGMTPSISELKCVDEI